MTELQQIAKQAISLLDLTSLSDSDTQDSISILSRKAKTPAGNTAAICIYRQFIPGARDVLLQNGSPDIKIATVTNFPHGGEDVALAVSETRDAVVLGADEVDVVFPYQAFMAGNEALGHELVKEAKLACEEKARLKVILETGVMAQPELIREACLVAIDAGADFIKTSTGKVSVNATLDAAEIMLKAIVESGQKEVGFKPAGGVRSVEDAKAYLALANEIMGAGWVSPQRFRFGASGLLDALLAELGHGTQVSTSSY